MSFVREYVLKYNGVYAEEPIKRVHTYDGVFSSKIEKGNIQFDFGNLLLYFNDSEDGIFRMRVKLKKRTKYKLAIFPRSSIGKIAAFILSNFKSSIPKRIFRNYKFSGSKNLHDKLFRNEELINDISSRRIGINLSRDEQILSLNSIDPIGGISDLEKFTRILKHISSELN